MSRQSIPRLQTVDQQSGLPQSSGASMASIVTWLVVGFNAGAILVMCMLFAILPLVLSDFEIRRASSQNANASAVDMVVLITETVPPTSTPTQTNTPVPTEVVQEISTATPSHTLTSTPAITNTPQVIITIPPTQPPASPTPIPPTNPPPNSFRLSGITFYQQGWNNCGPANLAMGLSFFGWDGTQDDTASFLKPDREDKNVTPTQMVEYVNGFTSLNAIWRMAGDIETLQWLISNEFVVIVESGYDPRNGEGWYGHYETVVAYNDAQQQITVYDSYLGNSRDPEVTRSYEAFDRDWQAFNRNYIVIYPAYREAELRAFLGDNWIDINNRRHAATVAQQEVSDDPENGYAWFNLGTSLTALGRYEDAVLAYERAFEDNLPYRMLWYQFGPYEALLQTSRIEDVLTLANSTLRTTIYVEETYYYKGRVFEIQGNYTAAIEQYTLALDLNPNYTQAQAALERVQS